jgi:hypothetical protein
MQQHQVRWLLTSSLIETKAVLEQCGYQKTTRSLLEIQSDGQDQLHMLEPTD